MVTNLNWYKGRVWECVHCVFVEFEIVMDPKCVVGYVVNDCLFSELWPLRWELRVAWSLVQGYVGSLGSHQAQPRNIMVFKRVDRFCDVIVGFESGLTFSVMFVKLFEVINYMVYVLVDLRTLLVLLRTIRRLKAYYLICMRLYCACCRLALLNVFYAGWNFWEMSNFRGDSAEISVESLVLFSLNLEKRLNF